VSSLVCLFKGCLIHLFPYSYLTDSRQHLIHLSSYNYLTDRRQCLFHLTFIRLSILIVGKTYQTFVFIHLSYNHFPQWNYTIPNWSRIPFSSTNLGIPLWFLVPIKMSLPSCIHNCITSISQSFHNIFGPSNQRFHLRISRRRNLNRGICHTPFFDPRWHWHVSVGPE